MPCEGRVGCRCAPVLRPAYQGAERLAVARCLPEITMRREALVIVCSRCLDGVHQI